VQSDCGTRDVVLEGNVIGSVVQHEPVVVHSKLGATQSMLPGSGSCLLVVEEVFAWGSVADGEVIIVDECSSVPGR